MLSLNRVCSGNEDKGTERFLLESRRTAWSCRWVQRMDGVDSVCCQLAPCWKDRRDRMRPLDPGCRPSFVANEGVGWGTSRDVPLSRSRLRGDIWLSIVRAFHEVAASGVLATT